MMIDFRIEVDREDNEYVWGLMDGDKGSKDRRYLASEIHTCVPI